ncbi:MAG: hypothetical protein ACJ790_07285, partial [Myxococcaceae bacterium]
MISAPVLALVGLTAAGGFSPEFSTDPAVVSTTSQGQGAPLVAFDGTNYLVVWSDGRHGIIPDGTGAFTYESDVFATRVTPSGVVLDPEGIPIATARKNQHPTHVGFDGTNYLVVWNENPPASAESDIYAARVSPAGVVLGTTPIAVSTSSSDSGGAVAFDGTNFLVVYSLQGQTLVAVRISKAGVILDTTPIAITTLTTSSATGPVAAFDGTNFLVGWVDTRNYNTTSFDIFAARVTPAGTVLDPNGFAVCTQTGGQQALTEACGGGQCLLAWADPRTSGTQKIYAARVSGQGAVLDATGIAVATSTNGTGFPATAYDGTNFMVTWQEDRSGGYDILAARVSPAGALLDSTPAAVSAANAFQENPGIAFDGTNYFVAWGDNRGPTG